ncbi:MAG: MOSC N-terminal beta barrel domain-containing protein [Pseudomonadota bacterium]
MTAVTDLWRYPVKAHGRDRVDRVAVTAGRTLPWDRVWAVAHDKSGFDDAAPAWMPCGHFARGAAVPALQAITAQVDEPAGRITFSHPKAEPITVDLATQAGAAIFMAWTQILHPPEARMPVRLVQAPGRGMTDTDYPSISLMNQSTLRAVSQKAGWPIGADRFRGNIWVDDLPPWGEFDWVGQEITVGAVRFRVVEPITRCMAITVDPNTGRRDVPLLDVLEDGWGHRDFGVALVALGDGPVAVGDQVHA